jgi:hypothetical protein
LAFHVISFFFFRLEKIGLEKGAGQSRGRSSVGSSPVGLRHLDSVHAAAFSLHPHGCGRRRCSSASLIALGWKYLAETCCKHGLLFCAMFPCGINPGTEMMGVWTGFVLEHNVHFSVVGAVGVVSLPSGFWMAMSSNIDSEERAREAVPSTVSGYPVELVTETGSDISATSRIDSSGRLLYERPPTGFLEPTWSVRSSLG